MKIEHSQKTIAETGAHLEAQCSGRRSGEQEFKVSFYNWRPVWAIGDLKQTISKPGQSNPQCVGKGNDRREGARVIWDDTMTEVVGFLCDSWWIRKVRPGPELQEVEIQVVTSVCLYILCPLLRDRVSLCVMLAVL